MPTSLITDHPPNPTYDMQGEGGLLIPRSSMVPFYIDLRPEAGVLLPLFGGLFCGSNEIRHLPTNRRTYSKISVYINIHKTHYFNVCVPAQ